MKYSPRCLTLCHPRRGDTLSTYWGPYLGAKFLDHAAAEAAIRESRAYADYLADITTALRHHGGHLEESWQGDSYRRFCENLDNLLRQLDQVQANSIAATAKINYGLSRARDDEREADRQAALRAQQNSPSV